MIRRVCVVLIFQRIFSLSVVVSQQGYNAGKQIFHPRSSTRKSVDDMNQAAIAAWKLPFNGSKM